MAGATSYTHGWQGEGGVLQRVHGGIAAIYRAWLDEETLPRLGGAVPGTLVPGMPSATGWSTTLVDSKMGR